MFQQRQIFYNEPFETKVSTGVWSKNLILAYILTLPIKSFKLYNLIELSSGYQHEPIIQDRVSRHVRINVFGQSVVTLRLIAVVNYAPIVLVLNNVTHNTSLYWK